MVRFIRLGQLKSNGLGQRTFHPVIRQTFQATAHTEP